ncbi:MAG: hypothetical protein R2867_43590 [Caldilineaceae bacterium]
MMITHLLILDLAAITEQVNFTKRAPAYLRTINPTAAIPTILQSMLSSINVPFYLVYTRDTDVNNGWADIESALSS